VAAVSVAAVAAAELLPQPNRLTDNTVASMAVRSFFIFLPSLSFPQNLSIKPDGLY
jgi:hypothetical protein